MVHREGLVAGIVLLLVLECFRMVSKTKAHAIAVRREGGSELDGTGFSRIGIPPAVQ